jgi:hypothetical protein
VHVVAHSDGLPVQRRQPGRARTARAAGLSPDAHRRPAAEPAADLAPGERAGGGERGDLDADVAGGEPAGGDHDLHRRQPFSVSPAGGHPCSRIALSGTAFANDVNAIALGEIWRNVGIAALYAIAYITFALCAGLLLFEGRELGGGEG